MKFNISYIFATRNRLPFLKLTLQRLLDELQGDEEIVVVDGNSTDGSKAYLQGLLEQGKIHQFVSENDKNQSHAWNKAMLLAKGDIIKKIIDDDVFCYTAIRKCKNYMLLHPEVDVLLSNDLSCELREYKNIDTHNRLPYFEEWNKKLVPSFTFGDVHMLIRRSSLSYIGLYYPAFVMMDWEYSLRISYLQANICYYTGFNALSVMHPQSVSALKDLNLIQEQGKRGEVFYEYKGDQAHISLWSRVKIFIGEQLYAAKMRATSSAEPPSVDVNVAYSYLYSYLSKLNDSQEFKFHRKD